MDNNKLWRREPRRDIFVDLVDSSLPYDYVFQTHLESANHRFQGKQHNAVKSDRVSTEFRIAGNHKFKQRRWRLAMEYYNQSLRFAEENSETMSLAYANRSACFFHMQKYNHCVKDIALARVHNYPKRLEEKLDEREVKCVKYLNEENDSKEEEEIEPKLSFDGDEKFPCMANVLEIKTNYRFGRHVVAKCDIDVGQTVLVEKGFVTVFHANDRTLCLTCMKHVKNFIPCSGCTDAMFCDETCMRDNDIHQIACRAPFNRIPFGNVQIWAQSILIAIKSFPSVEHLMEFVHNQLTSPQTEMPRNCTEAQLQYGLFLKSKKMCHDNDQLQNIMKYITYRLLMAIPTIGEKFTTKKKQRFLMHLIWQHKTIQDMNSLVQIFADTPLNEEGEGKIVATCNIYGFFNHSCIPNLNKFFVENKQILITTRPVKKGEQLFVCYEQHLYWVPGPQRQELLKKIYDFDCECERCRPKSVIDSSTMEIDPLYKCIEEANVDTISSDKRKILLGMCYDFMRKYAHVACSNQILIVMAQMMYFLQKVYPEYRKVID